MATRNLCSSGDPDESVLVTHKLWEMTPRPSSCHPADMRAPGWDLLPESKGTFQPLPDLGSHSGCVPSPSLSSSFSLASPCPQVGVEVPLIKRVNNVSGDLIWQMGNKPGLGNNVKSVIPEVLWQQNLQRAAWASLLGWRMCETESSVIILGLQWTESWCWN